MKRSGKGLMFWALMGCAGLSHGASHQLDEAVRSFLGQTVTQAMSHSSGSASAARSGARQVVVVKRGETLARIVRAHFKDSPFSNDFIYKAFVALNPEAFPRKTHNIVTAGARLQVPTTADLLAMVEGSSPSSPSGATSAGATASHSSPSQQKNWVRFP
jgi:Tfp pilus assembly protein FimV